MADEMEGQTFEQEEDEALKFMEEQQRKKEEKLQDEMEDYQESRKHEKQAMENEIEELKRKKIERAKQREEDEKRMALQRREEEIKRKAEEEERKKRKAAEEEKRKKERERKRRENERMKEKSKGPNFTIVKKEGGDKKIEEEEKKPPQKTKEQLEKEKQAALSTRITALNEDLQGTEALAEYAKELHNQIRNLVSNMYNLEDTYKRHQYDIVELQERARAMSKTKKRGVASVQYDDSYDRMNDRFSNAPPKVLLCSKYERHTDNRSFDERQKLYENLTANVQAELAREQMIREQLLRGGGLENGDIGDELSGSTADD